MAATRIKLNLAGFRKLRRSPEVAADLEKRARRIADAAGPGHEVEVTKGRTRALGMVWTDTHEARRNEATNRSLTRAIDAGR
ncbi:MAG: hypothetical protein IPH38_18075 [Candidatus Microthrix sp.]|jgi:hypothetical protein|nr:hypothetical protein [Candidatus Microthrix sp.]MBK7021440.1 hypothetical protein [Candidatus Microthrix sp.]